MVNGFFDVENRLDYLTANGDILPTLKNLIPWKDFRSDLEVIYAHERKSNAGRRPFDVVMMFKILILQSLYNLSDDEMEYQIMDRLRGDFLAFMHGEHPEIENLIDVTDAHAQKYIALLQKTGRYDKSIIYSRGTGKNFRTITRLKAEGALSARGLHLYQMVCAA